MGLSWHDPAYEDMKNDIDKYIREYIGIPMLPDIFFEKLVDKLFSIMNDHGAVDWT